MQWARVEREGWTLAQCDHPGRRNRHHEEIPLYVSPESIQVIDDTEFKNARKLSKEDVAAD